MGAGPLKTLVAFAILFAGAARAEAPQLVADLLSVQGDQAVVVIRFKDGESRELGAAVGMKLYAWDKIRTSPGSIARIRYLDGATALIGRDTQLELQPKQDGAQFNSLSFGQVRAQVPPEPGKAGAPKATAVNDRPRFLIRTKSAVMGVRGTDFVAGFDAASGSVQLRTFEGVVDIGASEQGLMSGQALAVPAGSGADIGGLAEPPRVQPFARARYQQELAQAQPEMSQLPARSAQPADGILPSERSEYLKAKAREPEPEAARGRFQLKQFAAGAVGVMQLAGGKHSYTSSVGDGQGKLISVELAYLPSIRLLGPVWIRGLLSAMPLKGVGGEYFLGTQVGALVALDLLDPLWLEAGGGLEKWPGSDGPSGLFVRAQVGWVLSETSFLERLYFAASVFGDSNSFGDVAAQAHAGLGFRL